MLKVIPISIMAYCIISQVVTRWDLPEWEAQCLQLEKEMKQVNVGQYFMPVDNEPFSFYAIKVGSCNKSFYISNTMKQTIDKYIEIHQKHGWTLETKNKKDGREVTLIKGKLRTYIYTGYEDNVKDFLAKYTYRDGYFEE